MVWKKFVKIFKQFKIIWNGLLNKKLVLLNLENYYHCCSIYYRAISSAHFFIYEYFIKIFVSFFSRFSLKTVFVRKKVTSTLMKIVVAFRNWKTFKINTKFKIDFKVKNKIYWKFGEVN